MSTNLEIARKYLEALESGVTGTALAEFFAPDVVQEEFPNRLVPQGVRRDLAALLEGVVRGQQVLTKQRFDVQNAVTSGE